MRIHERNGGKSNVLYSTWESMRNRCNNQNNKRYKDYGGRGIKVCKQWDSFKTFEADMGPRPEGYTLGRIDNNGDYEPNNCEWQTRATQSANRRPSNTWSVTPYRGERHHKATYTDIEVYTFVVTFRESDVTQKDFAKARGVKPSTFSAWLKGINRCV